MAQVGNLGKLIVFEVSNDKVLTFKNMNRTVSGRWTTHEPVSSKPVPEFLGPGQGSINLAISLSVNHGVRPRKTIERMEEAVEKGTPFPFVVGGKKVGSHQWVITNMSETWDEIIKDGQLASASLTLSLAEYV